MKYGPQSGHFSFLAEEPELLAEDTDGIQKCETIIRLAEELGHGFQRDNDWTALIKLIKRSAFHRMYEEHLPDLSKEDLERWKAYLPANVALLKLRKEKKQPDPSGIEVPDVVLAAYPKLAKAFANLTVRYHEDRKNDDVILLGQYFEKSRWVLIARWRNTDVQLPTLIEVADIVKARNDIWATGRVATFRWAWAPIIVVLFIHFALSRFEISPLSYVVSSWWSFGLIIVLLTIVSGTFGTLFSLWRNRKIRSSFGQLHPHLLWAL